MFAALITPQLRSWTRIGIILAALAITAAALMLTALLKEARKSKTSRARVLYPLLIGGLVLLLADGFFARSPIEPDVTTKQDLATFISSGQQQLADDCAVLNIPIVAFPEAVPKGSMQAYDHLLPYLVSNDLRFSYGAIKGQLGSRWTDHLSVQPGEQAEQARLAGFCAMLVDRLGLDSTSASLEQYVEALGEPIAIAQDRWYLFDIGGSPTDADEAEIFTRPEVDYGTDFGPELVDDAGVVSRWTRSDDSAFRVWNPAAQPSQLIMNLPLTAAQCPSGQDLQVLVDGENRRAMSLAPGTREEIRIPLEIPARSFAEIELLTLSPRCDEGDQSGVGVKMEAARFTKVFNAAGDISFVSGYWDPEIDTDGSSRRWGNGSTGVIEIINTDSTAKTAVFRVDLQAPPCSAPQAVTIDVNGTTLLSQALTPGQVTPVSLPVALDGFGLSIIRLTSDSPGCTVSGDERNLGVAVINPTLR